MALPNAQLDLLGRIHNYGLKRRVEVYAVGGMIRDWLLGASSQDLDFVVLGSSSEFATGLAKELNAEYKVFKDFYTAKVVKLKGYGGITEIDFAEPRCEFYPFSGSLPEVKRGDLQADLKRRDFTINACAATLADYIKVVGPGRVAGLELKDVIIDPFSGYEDLSKRKIRVLHSKSFIDDPTRIFRAARYAVRIKGNIEKNTRKWLVSALKGEALERVSDNRKAAEIKKIVHEDHPGDIFNLLFELGASRFLSCIDVRSVESLQRNLEDVFSGSVPALPVESIYDEIMTVLYRHSENGIRDPIFGCLGFNRKKLKRMG